MIIQSNTKHRYKYLLYLVVADNDWISTALLNKNNKNADACENSAIWKKNKYVSKNV